MRLWRIVYLCFLPAAVKGLEGEGGHVICACGYFLIFLGYQKMLGVVWDPQTRTADG
jgi:hypothetical protein